MSRKRPSVPKELPPPRPLPDVVIPVPVAGLNYDPDTRDWHPAEPPREVIQGILERIDEPAPVGWVPTPPDATTPFYNAFNADPPTPPHHCDRCSSREGGWERLLAASRADTAAMKTHLLVTMSGR